MFKLTLAQINPTIGDMQGNLQLMLKAARQARDEGARLVVFPELSLTGYYPGDLLEDDTFMSQLDKSYEDLLRATRETPGVTWAVGVPVRNSGKGKPLHNALVLLDNGRQTLTYAKQLLPTYNVFDERRHFEPGSDVCALASFDGVRVGFLICEDAWNAAGQDYEVNPLERLAQAAPDILVTLNASPSHLGKREVRQGVISDASRRYGLPVVYVNQVGGHDQLVYDGGSFATSKNGDVVFEAERFKQATHTLSFDQAHGSFLDRHAQELPAPDAQGLEPMEFYRRQIVLGIQDYARRCGFKRVVVGCSGGIDSALTLALAVEALGPRNVHAVTMPSDFSSVGSVSDSEKLCSNLGIELSRLPISDLVGRYRLDFDQHMSMDLHGLTQENLQARIRGTLLMALSNQYDFLLLTTGNKSEVSVGYSTLYGDSNGGLGPIGDLYKTEVFALSRHINKVAGREIIPQAILEKEPSAELAPGQKDSDSLPPYEVLDEVLKLIIEGRLLSPEEKAHSQAMVDSLPNGPELMQQVRRMVSRSEYKRRQAAPIVRVRARAFGSGRQVPIAAVHH